MNINQAKEEIRKTVQIYLAKDKYGEYLLPVMKQRPIFMVGAPGLGKTAIVEQVAAELDIGLVSYAMTHHTRQSTIGLPYIAEHVYGGESARVSEYTMSEILASVYQLMEKTGKAEGILFLDEINYVSETLAPAILQFLQYKTFGNHSLPHGWVIVSAGNPPQYNRSVREFDIATRDRLKYLVLEEDFDVWKRYAYDHCVHAAIIAFLEINRQWFFSIRSTVDGFEIATARGWEDLSYAIRLYEDFDYKIDPVLISQYITNPEIYRKFSAFYDLFKKYQEDYQIEDILDRSYTEETVKKAEEGAFSERIALIEMTAERLTTRLLELMERKTVLETAAVTLREIKKILKEEDLHLKTAPLCMDLINERINRYEEERKARRLTQVSETDETRKLRQVISLLKKHLEIATGAPYEKQFAMVKKYFDQRAKRFASEIDKAKESLEHIFTFLISAWGTGLEMTYFLTLLTSNRYCNTFISSYGCDSYYKYNDKLLLYDVKENLRNQIMLTLE